MADKDEDMSTYPKLGQIFGWVEKPGSVAKLIALLVLACVVVVLWDFTYDKYGHFMEETLIGAYAIFGFVSFTGLILAAKGLRVLVGQREDYYAPYVIDAEGDYPEDQIERKDHDA
ncbi:MAG: hypothetical protein AAGJ34_09890 [Pseudomonadota bacterium]